MNKINIKQFFFRNPTAKKRVRELERDLNISLPSIIRYCKELEDEHILTTYEIGTVRYYTANVENESFLLQKKLFNIESLYESKLIEYLKTHLSNPVIILFGSFAKGEDTEASDIDLYIQTPSNKSLSLKSFEEILQRNIQVFKHSSLEEIPNSHLKNNILNGIVLNNHIEVFK